MSRLIISQLSAVNFVDSSKQNLNKYFSRHMDDYIHSVRLNEYQLPAAPFFQRWSHLDQISLQLITDAGTPSLEVISCSGAILISAVSFSQVRQNTTDPNFYLYEIGVSLNTLPQGIFYIRITIGSTFSLISEPMVVTSELQNSLLIEYKNRSFYHNMIFETGFYSSMRINGLLRFKQPASKDTLYEDQVLDSTMLYSKPFRIWELVVGFKDPVADFLIDKLNRIFGCSDILIDGKHYTKNEGAKWEEIENVSYHATKIYTIELRDVLNKTSKTFDTTVYPGGIFTPEFEFEFQ